MIRYKVVSPFLMLTLAAFIVLLGCGGDGGGGGGQTSTIRGTVSGVTAMVPIKEKPSMLAQLGGFFSLSRAASAQGSGVAGIKVIAQENGKDVDDDVTDSNGNFTLNVPPGNVTLVFNNFNTSTTVIAPEGGTLIIVVALQPNQVVVQDMEIQGTIRCETGDVSFAQTSLTINGEGGDCISIQGNCSITVPGDITLTNCQRCINAGGGANLTLGVISCDANGDGIDTAGNAGISISGNGIVTISARGNGISATGTSEISMGVNGGISVTGMQDGIKAQGNSQVTLNPVGQCTVGGRNNPVQIDGNATVNTGSCILAPLP